ncbi:hypothetical protein [Nocardioides pyridinolyticus]
MTTDTSQGEGPAGPEAMRELVRAYVYAVHAAYLDHTRHLSAGERGALPLVAGEHLTVVAAASRQLHLVATTDTLPAPQGREVEYADEHLGVTWRLRFYDPSVVPALGLLVDDRAEEVRRVLGIGDTLYHLSVDVGGGLGVHHAQHSGVALANQHTKQFRDLERVRRALPQREQSIDELGVCVRNGLARAAALLAADLSSGRLDAGSAGSAADSLAALADDVAR